MTKADLATVRDAGAKSLISFSSRRVVRSISYFSNTIATTASAMIDLLIVLYLAYIFH